MFKASKDHLVFILNTSEISNFTTTSSTSLPISILTLKIKNTLSFSTFFKITEDLCKSISEKFGDNTTRVQQSSLSQLKRDISDLSIEKLKLHELLGHSFNDRFKRGWFNIVGKFAKELFGTMDTEDAEYIDHKLNDFDSNESQLISLIKEQSHVVRTTIVNFNNTSNYLNQNLDALVSNIAGITKSLDLVNSNTLLLEIEIKFDEHLILLTHLINTLKNEYSSH